MPTNNYQLANAAYYPGGGLSAYASGGYGGPPFPNPYGGGGGGGGGFNSRDAIGAILSGGGSGGMGPWGRAAGFIGTGGVSEIVGGAVRKFFGGGDDNRPQLPYWQRMANREWGQGNAVLSAYEALYPRTLAMQQRQAGDYGDLYRRAANEALAHNIQSASATRAADLGDYAQLSPLYYEAVRKADPLATGVRDSLYNIIQGDAARINDPMSSAAAREVRQGALGDAAQHGFGPSGRQAALAYISQGLTGEQLSTARRNQLFQTSLQFLGANQQAMGDAFQAITGRPSMPQPQGANIMAPKVGTDWDDLLSYGINREVQSRNMKSAREAATMGMAGDIIGGLLSGAGSFAAMCWVAREVFGEERDHAGRLLWVMFRTWVLTRAPRWFARVYLLCGPGYAAYLREHEDAKPGVRAWMEERINELI